MSRVGKRPLAIPEGVRVWIEEGTVRAKGPKGELAQPIHPKVLVQVEDTVLHVLPGDESREARAMRGLIRTLIGNMVQGVSKGFTRELEIVGVGYRAEAKEDKLMLNVGYSQPVEFTLPTGVTVSVEKQTKITLGGIDNVILGQTAATIRGFRPPEPYKGKGIRFKGEEIRRKVGKAGSR